MRGLASEGLVNLDNHRFGIVRFPDWDEMVEIVEIRRSLEALAMKQARAHISVAQLAHGRAMAADLSEEEV